MPFRWYVWAVVAFTLCGLALCWVAERLLTIVPEQGRLIELIGTLITLLPVELDLFRKYYVRKNRPSETSHDLFAAWAQQRVYEALMGYERLYAVAIFVGVSFVAVGFAMDLLKPA